MLGPVAQAASATEMTVGYLYVGARNDYGYNQNHAVAAQAVGQLPGVRLVEQERVPESDKVAVAMEAMILEDNARIVFPTSYGYYQPYVLELAQAYPDVYFMHCGSSWRAGEDPNNIGSYVGHMHEGQHLAGIAAAHAAPAGRIGFVASFRYPGVLRNINAFALGAQRVNPDMTMQVVFIGNWADPVREAEAVNTMADQGVEVIGCSVDSARTVVETAQRRGIRACGHNASVAQLAPASYLTAAIADWSVHNLAVVQTVQQGGKPPNFFSGGLAEGLVTVDLDGQLNAAMRTAIAARRHELVAGNDWIWTGPLYDNTGTLQVAPGIRLERDQKPLRGMDWFVRGVSA